MNKVILITMYKKKLQEACKYSSILKKHSKTLGQKTSKAIYTYSKYFKVFQPHLNNYSIMQK